MHKMTHTDKLLIAYQHIEAIFECVGWREEEKKPDGAQVWAGPRLCYVQDIIMDLVLGTHEPRQSAQRIMEDLSTLANQRLTGKLPHFDGHGPHRYEDGQCVYCDARQ